MKVNFVDTTGTLLMTIETNVENMELAICDKVTLADKGQTVFVGTVTRIQGEHWITSGRNGWWGRDKTVTLQAEGNG